MTTKYTIIAKHLNGETTTFKDAVNFSIMKEGLLYVEAQYTKNEYKAGKILLSTATKSMRHWVSLQIVKSIEVQTTVEITDKAELQKYLAFKDKGIDITVTKVSHTEPPDPKEVAREIAEEEKNKKC